MLDLKPENLILEIRAAQEFIKPFVEQRTEMIRALASRNYRAESGSPSGSAQHLDIDPSPENYAYTYKAFIRPQILFGVPHCNVTAVSGVEDIQTAQALEMAVNSWAKHTAWKQTLSEVMDDVFVGFAVTKCGVEPRGDYATAGETGVEGDFDQSPNYPFVVRIEPRFFLIDPKAKKMSKARYVGHTFERDLADVQTDERYDPAKAATLANVDRDDKPDQAPFPSTDRTPPRKRITLYELYLPEYAKIITMAESGGDGCVILRDEEFIGPPEGPYTLWGLDTVPGEIIPISPLTALWDQVEKANEHARDSADSAATYKNLIGFMPSAADDAKTIKNARNGDVIPILDVNGVKNFTVGGVTKDQLGYAEVERQRTDRNLGFTDAQRGAVNSDTATSNQISQSNSDVRLKGMRDSIKTSLVSALSKVGWYFENDSSIGQIDVMHTDPATGQQRGATFVAGKEPGAYVQNTWIPSPPQADANAFHFDIDGSTMQAVDDAIEMKRAQDEFALVMQAAPLIPQMPWINWQALFRDLGKAMNDPLMADRILNLPALQMQQMMMQQNQMMDQQQQQMGMQQQAQQPPAQQNPQPPRQSGPPNRGRSPSSRPGLMHNARAGVATGAR